MTPPNRIFLLVGFLDLMSVFFILPYLDNRAKEIGFNYIQIGLVGAVFPGCQMISSAIVGSLSDVRGRKPILILCLIICSLAYFWLGITSSLFVFLGLRIVLGTFKHTQTLTRALVPDYIGDPNKVSVFYGKLMSLGAFGLAIGPVLSGYVMEAFPESGFSIMCAILSAVFVLNAGLIRSLPPISNERKDQSEKALRTTKLFVSIVDTFKQTVNKFYNVDWTIYWDLFFFKLLMSMSMGLYYSNFRLFLKTEHDLSPVFLGYIVAFESIISSIVNNSVAYVNKIYDNDRDYSQRIFHIFLVLVLSLIGLAVVPGIPMYIVLLIPKGVSFAFARIVTLAAVTNRSVPSNRGTLIGVFNSVSSVSGIVTPILSGLINHYLGVTCVFFAGAIFATIGFVLSYQARSRSLQDKIK